MLITLPPWLVIVHSRANLVLTWCSDVLKSGETKRIRLAPREFCLAVKTVAAVGETHTADAVRADDNRKYITRIWCARRDSKGVCFYQLGPAAAGWTTCTESIGFTWDHPAATATTATAAASDHRVKIYI